MIGQVVLTVPMVAMLVYGWLEFKRVWVVGIGVSVLSLAAIYFVWFPIGAAAVAETLQLGTRDDLVLYCWIGLSSLVLLNLHLKSRQQMQVVVGLIRQSAIASRSSVPGQPDSALMSQPH